MFEPLDTSFCNLAPSVRPFLWRNANGNGDFDRWWSNPRAYPLAAGTATLTVPLQAEHWSSVNGRFGHEDAATRFAFEKALLNVTRLGLTFGGGCSFGHGIRVSGGTATLPSSEVSAVRLRKNPTCTARSLFSSHPDTFGEDRPIS